MLHRSAASLTLVACTLSQPSPNLAGPIHLGPRGGLPAATVARKTGLQHSARVWQCPSIANSPCRRRSRRDEWQTISIKDKMLNVRAPRNGLGSAAQHGAQ